MNCLHEMKSVSQATTTTTQANLRLADDRTAGPVNSGIDCRLMRANVSQPLQAEHYGNFSSTQQQQQQQQSNAINGYQQRTSLMSPPSNLSATTLADTQSASNGSISRSSSSSDNSIKQHSSELMTTVSTGDLAFGLNEYDHDYD